MPVMMPDRLAEGINLFNAQRYFEAHEVWEDLWREEAGDLRLFYQGLIQAAVGLHHLSRGNVRGGRSQLTKSLAKLDRYPSHSAGVDLGKLRGDLRGLLDDPSGVLINKPRIYADG
jgi:predicted metal-dependent hydrolase